jgi:uncharacterized protein YbjT (DUF2867 family)
MIRYATCLPALVVIAAAAAGCAGGGAERDDAPLVFVAGATGGTGRAVVEQAIEKGFRVRVFVRDEAKARAIFGERVAYVVGDVRNAAVLPAAVDGADYVVSALGSNSRREPENKPELIDYGGVKALAEAASGADVRHFVLVSSMGVTDPDQMLNRILDNVLQWKLRGEDALRASGVKYTVVRPGGLRDGPPGVGGLVTMQGDPKGVAGQIARSDVAAICVNALGRRAAYGRTFEVIGDPQGSPVTDWDRFFAALRADD